MRPKPWKTGKHPNHTCFQILVTISLDAEERLWTEHEFTTTEDQQLSMSLPNGGVPQIALALLTEAARREMFCSVLARLSADPTFLDTWMTSSDEEKRAIEVELANVAISVMNRSMTRLALPTAGDILGMMARGKV